MRPARRPRTARPGAASPPCRQRGGPSWAASHSSTAGPPIRQSTAAASPRRLRVPVPPARAARAPVRRAARRRRSAPAGGRFGRTGRRRDLLQPPQRFRKADGVRCSASAAARANGRARPPGKCADRTGSLSRMESQSENHLLYRQMMAAYHTRIPSTIQVPMSLIRQQWIYRRQPTGLVGVRTLRMRRSDSARYRAVARMRCRSRRATFSVDPDMRICQSSKPTYDPQPIRSYTV